MGSAAYPLLDTFVRFGVCSSLVAYCTLLLSYRLLPPKRQNATKVGMARWGAIAMLVDIVTIIVAHTDETRTQTHIATWV